jgi:hypothetical protein
LASHEIDARRRIFSLFFLFFSFLSFSLAPTGSQASLGQRAQVHQLLALGAPHPLVLEGPQGTLEALLIVTRHRHPTEA